MGKYPKLPRGADIETIRKQLTEHPKASKLSYVLDEFEQGRFLASANEVIEFIGHHRISLLRNKKKQIVTDRDKVAVQVLRAFWRKSDNQIFEMLDNPLRQEHRKYSSDEF
jgi:hypothetical protein